MQFTPLCITLAKTILHKAFSGLSIILTVTNKRIKRDMVGFAEMKQFVGKTEENETIEEWLYTATERWRKRWER